MPRREYHEVQGAYVDRSVPPDPFIASLRAQINAQRGIAAPTEQPIDSHESMATGSSQNGPTNGKRKEV